MARIGLEPVWKGHILAASRLTINWIMAIRIHASVVSGKASEVLTQSARAVEPSEGAFDDPAPVQDPSWQTLIDRDDDMERLMDSEKESKRFPGVCAHKEAPVE